MQSHVIIFIYTTHFGGNKLCLLLFWQNRIISIDKNHVIVFQLFEKA